MSSSPEENGPPKKDEDKMTDRELIMQGLGRSKVVRDREWSATWCLWGLAALGVPKVWGLLTVSEHIAAWGFASGIAVVLIGIVLWSIGKLIAGRFRRGTAPPPITNAQSAQFYSVEESALDFMQDAKMMVLHLTTDTQFEKVVVPATAFQANSEWHPVTVPSAAQPVPAQPETGQMPLPVLAGESAAA